MDPEEEIAFAHGVRSRAASRRGTHIVETRCDGIIPGHAGTPDDIRAMRTWLTDRGAPADLDVLAEGETPADDGATA
jgi:hypothetical protein